MAGAGGLDAVPGEPGAVAMLTLQWSCDRCGVVAQGPTYQHNNLLTQVARQWRNHMLASVPDGWIVKQIRGKWQLVCNVCRQGLVQRLRGWLRP